MLIALRKKHGHLRVLAHYFVSPFAPQPKSATMETIMTIHGAHMIRKCSNFHPPLFFNHNRSIERFTTVIITICLLFCTLLSTFLFL